MATWLRRPRRETRPDGRYDAFISYSHAQGRLVAEALQTEVERFAKPWYRPTSLRIFRDITNLSASPHLWTTISAALAASDWLVLMASPTAAESPWVKQEVDWWRANRTADTMLIAWTDGKLAWSDRDTDFDWENTDAVPRNLEGFFPGQPRWVDLRPVMPGGTAAQEAAAGTEPGVRLGDLAADFAAPIRGVEKSTLVGRHIRERRRIRRTLATTIAALLVLTIAAGIGFVRATIAEQNAEQNATEALAQADAAEALLLAETLPTVAIDRVLSAAERSATPTVRSAMLAVSQATQRLVRAFPDPAVDDGTPSTAVAFSHDGAHVLAWGGTGSTSTVQMWDLATGRSEVAATVPVPGLRDLTVVTGRELAGCSDAGPAHLRGANAELRLLADNGETRRDRECLVVEYAQGVVLLERDGEGSGTAFLFDRRGGMSEVDGVDGVTTHPGSSIAALVGPVGLTLVTGTDTTRVDSPPGTAVHYADDVGNLVAAAAGSWITVMQTSDGPLLTTRSVPAEVVDVAPVLEWGRMTGDLTWITDDGIVGWTADDRRTQLGDSQGQFGDSPGRSGWDPFATTIEPLDSGFFIAVFRSTATVLRAPGRDSPDSEPNAVPLVLTEWHQSIVEERLGVAEPGRPDPILGRCTNRGAVLLSTDVPEGGSLLVDSAADARRLNGRGQLTGDCSAVDTSNTLSLTDSQGGTLSIREGFVADDVAVSPLGTEVAVLKTGFPIEVLTMVPEDDLPRPWDVVLGGRGMVTSFGEREVLLEPGSNQLIVANSTGGVVSRTPIEVPADLIAVRPDGAGGALQRIREPGALLVDDRQVTETAGRCDGLAIHYLPGRDFRRSREAAEAQIPAAATEDGTVVDCRSGRPADVDDGLQVLGYDLDETAGRIIFRDADGVAVATWSRSGEPDVETRLGPAPLAKDEQVSFDRSARTAVVFRSNSRELSVYRHTRGDWEGTLRLATNLPTLVEAAIADEGTLVLAVGSTGGFEMFDAEAGRLVASDPSLEGSYVWADVTSVSVRRVRDDLVVGLHPDGHLESIASLRIPVGAPALRSQLCSLYASELC